MSRARELQGIPFSSDECQLVCNGIIEYMTPTLFIVYLYRQYIKYKQQQSFNSKTSSEMFRFIFIREMIRWCRFKKVSK